MVTQTVTLKVAIHETSGCELRAHGELGWHPNITGVTPVVVDGLSSDDEQ
jgi:hypothetical protein